MAKQRCEILAICGDSRACSLCRGYPVVRRPSIGNDLPRFSLPTVIEMLDIAFASVIAAHLCEAPPPTFLEVSCPSIDGSS
jgi:hypothetical protein